MEVHMMKVAGGWVPASAVDEDLLQTYKAGQVIKATIKRPRNGAHHRKMMALLQVVFANQDKYDTLQDLLVEIKLKAGHYEEHVTMKGKLIYLPKSINFSSMTQDEFVPFYEKVLTIVLRDFLQYDDPAQLEREVNMYMGFM